MKDAKTRAEEFIETTFDFSMLHSVSAEMSRQDFLKCYLAGDSDRERLMKEEEGKWIRDISESYASLVADQVRDKNAILVPEDVCEAVVYGFTIARADRQELVDCVLEMAKTLDLFSSEDGTDDPAWGCIEKHATLINRLREEKEGR